MAEQQITGVAMLNSSVLGERSPSNPPCYQRVDHVIDPNRTPPSNMADQERKIGLFIELYHRRYDCTLLLALS